MSTRTARQARSRKANGKPKEVVVDGKKKVVVEKVAEVQEPEEPEISTCLTCVEEITYFAIGDACDHKDLCARCALRQRRLYGKPECVLCQAPHSKMVITKDGSKSFSDFDISTLPSMPEIGVYFSSRKVFNVFDALFKFTCPKCNHSFATLANLKSHLKDKHSLMYCDVCLDHVQNFLEEYEVYSANQLEKHVQGVGNQKGAGHPYCRFCKTAFFDEDTLWMHKYNEHTHCRVCVKTNDEYLFFGSYKTLLGHYKSKHYICKDPVCMASKHVVFESALELQQHMILNHTSSENMSRSQLKQARTLQLDFEFSAPTSQWRNRNGSQRSQRNRKQNEGWEEWPEEETFTPSAQQNTSQDKKQTKNEKKKNKTEETKKEEEDITSIELPPLPTSHEELKSRNRALIKVIRSSLLKDEYFGTFRQLNIDYVNGNELPAQDFHAQSIKLFQPDAVHAILMELMSLLPDVKKRVDLKNVHEAWYLEQQKKRAQEKEKLKQKQKQQEQAKKQTQKQKQQKQKQQQKQQQQKQQNKNSKPKNGVWQIPEQPVQEKKKEEKKAEQPEPESPDTLLSAPRDSTKNEHESLTSSSEFPSLGIAPPPGISSAAYSDRLQGRYSDSDFPTLPAGSPVVSGKQQTQQKPKSTPNQGKKKRKQQRKKNVLFTVGI